MVYVKMEWLKHLAIKKDGERILVNGWKQGTQYYKYLDGQLECECNYNCDQRHGIQRVWYENSQLWCEYNYFNDKRHGIQRGWSISGSLWFENNYINGIKQN
jgi:antitoxin component YwqK of YwqJK toxin-antitoxin module